MNGIDANAEVNGKPVACVVPVPVVEECPIAIEAPMGICETGYASDSIQVGALMPMQASALKRLRCSLADKSMRVQRRDANHKDGKVVDTNADAIRWILDQFAGNYQSESGCDITEGMLF